MSTPDMSSSNRQISRAAGTVMVAMIASNIVGLFKNILVAHTYGTGPDLEAFNAANRVGETLFNLMAGGALSSAFVPTFTGLLVKNEKEKAWKLASAISNLLLISLTVLSILSSIFAPWIVANMLAKGFSPEQQELTVQLLRVLLPSVVIFGISGLVMGILNSHQHFLVPALTPAMYSLGMILGIWLLGPSLGIFGMAWGAVIGAAMHLLFQLPALFKLHGSYRPTLGVHDPQVYEVSGLMLPRLFGAGIVQLNFWVNTLLCTFQGAVKLGSTPGDRIIALWQNNLAFPFDQGSLNGLTFAFTLMLMPQAAIAQSIAIASMPTFSAQASLDQYDELRHSLSASLRGVLLLAIPASVGLILLRVPVVALLYQHGNFSSQSTDLVAWPLLWYAAGLVGHSMVEVLSRAFYALHDTKTPVLVGAFAMLLNVVFSLLFSIEFTRIGWMPHGGLALANSLATGIEMVGLLVLLHKRLGHYEGKSILNLAGRSALASGLMALALWGWMTWAASFAVWIQASGGIVVGVLVYALILWWMKVPEFSNLICNLKRRFSRQAA